MGSESWRLTEGLLFVHFAIFILSWANREGLAALMLVTGLLATSLNMVLGFGGMYQFHHAVFYGFGAYTYALIATRSGLPAWTGYLAAPVFAGLLGLVQSLVGSLEPGLVAVAVA